MRGAFTGPLALLAARQSLPQIEAGDDIGGCAGSGLYMISVRGTGELPGIGFAGTFIGKPIKDVIKGSKVVSLDYPATLAEPNYMISSANGTQGLKSLVNSHVEACPQDKIAILGYSQGAQVTMDVLCGAAENGFAASPPIASDKIDKHIVAVALFGDPSHIANLTYDRGSSIRDGIFPRTNLETCAKYSHMIASWCDTGDVYCDLGLDMAVHGSYFVKYGLETIDFIVNKYKAAMFDGGSNGNATSTSNGTGISTSSGTGNGTSSIASASTTSFTNLTSPTDAVSTTASSTNGAQSTGSATTSGIAATTSKPGAANALQVASRGLSIALPLALAALFQLL